MADEPTAEVPRPTVPTTDVLLTADHSGTSHALILSALRLFNAQGFHATTTRSISDAAGVSPGTIYVHFPSKQALLFELCQIAHRSALRTVQEAGRLAARSGVTPDREAVEVIRAFASWHAQNPMLGRVSQYGFRSLEGASLATIVTLRQEAEATLREAIDRACTHLGLPPTHAYEVGTISISVSVDLARWFRRDGRIAPLDMGDIYANAMGRLLRAGGDDG